MSDRLYKDAQNKVLKRSQMQGNYKTYRNFEDQGMSTSRSPNNSRVGKKKINTLLSRMLQKDKKAKKRIIDLRKFKTLQGK